MAKNYKKLTMEALKFIRDEVVAEINAREAIVKAKLRQQFESVAASQGFSLTDIVAQPEIDAPAPKKPAKTQMARQTGVPSVKAKAKVASPPRYIHPTDKKRSWTGMGPRPRWINEFLESGGTLEQLQNPARVEANKVAAQKQNTESSPARKKTVLPKKAKAAKASGVTEADDRAAAVPAVQVAAE